MSELLPTQTFAPTCFCCGLENPSGLKLRFSKLDTHKISTTFTPPQDWTGWGNIVHGGFQSLLLDEIIAWTACGLLDIQSFVTREMTVTYHQPVCVGTPLTIVGELLHREGKKIFSRGTIQNDAGEILTEAKGLLISIPKKQLEAIS